MSENNEAVWDDVIITILAIFDGGLCEDIIALSTDKHDVYAQQLQQVHPWLNHYAITKPRWVIEQFEAAVDRWEKGELKSKIAELLHPNRVFH